MKKIGIILGGAGYIGSNLLIHLLKEQIFDQYLIGDIRPLEGFAEFENVLYKKIDVRKPIEIEGLEEIDPKDSWIFNLAAIHREPGHAYKEYFDTNVPGAQNVNRLARELGIQNIFFTSSIAPYGKSLEVRKESDPLYPETAYGISKGFAEKIHESWLAENTERRLIICRPSVIFGPRDPGNVYRMIKGLKKGTFLLPNGGKVIKAYGYVYGLVESFVFTMNKKEQRKIIYNYTENPLVPLNEMTQIAKKELGYTRPVLQLPTSLLALIAGGVQFLCFLIGKKSDIHPVRVRKAGFPTNIKPQYLIDNDFPFKYDFGNALRHWKNIEPDDFK